MKIKTLSLIAAATIDTLAAPSVQAQDATGPVIRIAELELYPEQMAAYSAAVKQEMEQSIRVEPGVLALYAVAIKGQANQLCFFEMYADQATFEAHRDSPHFRKYVEDKGHDLVSQAV